MLGWKPGTAELLPWSDLNDYLTVAWAQVQSEDAAKVLEEFMGSRQDDTARAQRLLKERGEDFRLTDLVLE